MRRILIIVVVVTVGTVVVFAYPPALRSLRNILRGRPSPTPQVTFLNVPASTGSTVFRLGVLPKDFPRELLPPVFYGLSAQRIVFTGGETQTIASFETVLSLEVLRAWYAQQLAASGWEVQNEHLGTSQVSLRATKTIGLSLVATFQDTEPTRRSVSLVYSVRPF